MTHIGTGFKNQILNVLTNINQLSNFIQEILELHVKQLKFSIPFQSLVMFLRSENKDYYLEAPDRAVMMFWLQELQKRRRNHATQRNSDFSRYKV